MPARKDGFMKRRIAILLVALLPATGCRSWNVRAFGTDINAVEPQGYQLSLEEQLGIALLIGVAAAGIAYSVSQ